jgi:lysozyme
MRTNKKGIDLIKKYEGLKLKPYLCPSNIPTIGYGSTFYEDGTKVTLKDPIITEKRANELLLNTIAKFEKGVLSLTHGLLLNDNQVSALVSFAFNVGLANLKKSTLLVILKANQNDKAIAGQFMRWNKSNGKVLAGLVTRRREEANLYFS